MTRIATAGITFAFRGRIGSFDVPGATGLDKTSKTSSRDTDLVTKAKLSTSWAALRPHLEMLLCLQHATTMRPCDPDAECAQDVAQPDDQAGATVLVYFGPSCQLARLSRLPFQLNV